jgi:hypothetical protein
MALTKFLAATVCAIAVSAAGCAEGTGKALTPTLPTPDANITNADGTRLKATTPEPAVPRGSVRITNLTPQLRLATARTAFGVGTLEYDFEVYEGSNRVANAERVPAGTETAAGWNVPANVLAQGKTYSWRARATFNGVPGSWSEMAVFLTPLPPPPVSAEGGPVACGGSSGIDIVRCVANAYPEKLVATARGDGSLERRKANMEFIRDRIIETGRCKGLDLARNFKRGTPVISHDFLVFRQPGQRDRGVDIATGYDDVNLPLRLKFQVFGADEDYGFPYYAGYPPVDCTGIN